MSKRLSRMLRSRRVRRNGTRQSGYALMTVMVFVVIVIISGAAIFALASYETKGAIYRQDSSEAFYLADGAIERARARFLEDRAWRDGWSDEAAGRGGYDLTVYDTTYAGFSDAVQILATGTVGLARRSIELLARVPASVFGMGLLIMGDASVLGNLCLMGDAHVNGEGEMGPHLHCGGLVTNGFDVIPPWIYTESDSFPEATYYYVRGCDLGGVYHARILDGDGVDLTTALGDSLVDVISYDAGTERFIYDFDRHSEISGYFDDQNGIFSRAGGDLAVVVNFGELPIVYGGGGAGHGGGKGKGGKGGGGQPIVTPAIDALSDVHFDGSASSLVHATIINTRFTGLTDSLRVDADHWSGGLTTMRKITFEPYYGIGMIVRDFARPGGAHAYMGTAAYPALLYVTGDVVQLNSNFVLVGSVICLGDWSSQGGITIIYDDGFMDHLPDYLQQEWQSGVSGTLATLRWREVAASS